MLYYAFANTIKLDLIGLCNKIKEYYFYEIGKECECFQLTRGKNSRGTVVNDKKKYRSKEKFDSIQMLIFQLYLQHSKGTPNRIDLFYL